MTMRRRAKEVEVADAGPLVRARQGLPVDVHVDTVGAVEDSPHARHFRRLDALRKTRELSW
jgi:hypothetical protein